MIVGPSSACIGQSSVYFFAPGYSSYFWTVLGGHITLGQGTNTITVSWLTSGPGMVTVEVENPIPPETLLLGTPYTLPVQVYPIPVPNISGASSCCESQQYNYTTNFNPGSIYTWTAVGGNVVAGQGTNTATIEWNSVGSSRQVQVYEANPGPCSGNDSFSVTVHAKPLPVISGPEEADINTTQTYSVSNTFTAYTWNALGGIIQSGQGTHEVTVLWNLPDAASISVNVTNSNSCSNQDTLNVTIMSLDSLSLRFVATYDPAMQPAMTDLLSTIQTGTGITTLPEMLGLGTPELAGQFASLSSSSDYVVGYTNWLKDTADSINQVCNAEENKKERFFSSQGETMRPALEWYVNEVLANNIPGFTDWKSLITTAESTISDEYAALGCSTPLKQSSANQLLQAANAFLGSINEQFEFFGVLKDYDKPLAGLTVKVIDTDNDNVLIGEDITDPNGLLSFSFSEFSPESGPVPNKHVNFEIYNAQGTLIDLVAAELDPYGPAMVPLVIDPPAAPADTTPVIASIATAIGATYPTGFVTYLTGKGITTLQDVRNFGGISHLEDLPGNVTPQLSLLIDQYASLNAVVPGINDCVALHDNGFVNAVAVAQAPRASFIDAITSGSSINSTEAGFYHASSVATLNIGSNVWASQSVFAYNNYLTIADNSVVSSDALQVKDLVLKRCDCDECRTAVSPAAYLAALMDYTIKNVKQSNGSAITISYLEDKFLQPFGRLTASCEDPNERVCQIRICIDVLTKYISVNLSGQDPVEKRRAFYRSVYNNMLIDLGTSLEEIRFIPSFSEAETQQFADRVGIAADHVNNTVFSLGVLEQGTSIEAIDRHLETYFGLVSFYKNPLSQGLSDSDLKDRIVEWNLTGIRWGYNVSPEGELFGKLTFATSKYTVSFYSDSSKTTDNMVCTGNIAAATGVINLTPVNNSGIFGTVRISYLADISNFTVQLIPRIVCYRLQQLHEGWKTNDQFPLPNPYLYYAPGVPAGRSKALVDPDIMSYDDIRLSTVSSRSSTTALAAIYENRINWLTTRKSALRTALFDTPTSPDFSAAYVLMKTAVNYNVYGGSPVPVTAWGAGIDPADFPDWYKILTGQKPGITPDISDMHLDTAAFTRFFEISKKFTIPVAEDALSKEQENLINEFLDIMLLSQKNAGNTTWMEEEEDHDIYPSQYLFYKSLTEPVDGVWPPLSRVDIPGIAVPLVEPQVYSIGEYVDQGMLYREYAGSPATNINSLYTSRTNTYKEDSTNIQSYRESVDQAPATLNGFESLLWSEETTGFGSTQLLEFRDGITVEADYSDHLLQLWADYNGDDPVARQTVVEKVYSDLHMSLAEYEQLMPLYEKQKFDTSGFAEGDWEIVYGIIVKAATRKNHYPGWLTKEGASDLNLTFWKVFKQKLNNWRATGQQREQWLEAVMRSLATPNMDPDNITPDYFNDTRDLGSGPFHLWNERKALIAEDWLPEIEAIDLKDDTTFINTVAAYFGAEISEMVELFQGYQVDGKDIGSRLTQLTLSMTALKCLVEYLQMLEALPPVVPTDEEEKSIVEILLQVRKIRNNVDPGDPADYFKWQSEEYQNNIYINPAVFALPQSTFADAYFDPGSGNPWRSDPVHIKAWNQTLGSRIQQTATTANMIKESAENAEEIDLVFLRDALVMVIQPALTELAQKADWITDNLLIDAKVQCCQPTTRIAQAIETFQTFLFSVRTETLDISPSPVLKSDSFDDDWLWLGSYASWRSLMFMYLYPENLLDPTFRGTQTDVFRQLSDTIRNNSRLNPAVTDQAMKDYFKYFKDIATLQAKASCTADYNGRKHNFVFGTGTETGTVYWTTYYAMALQPGDQKIWNPVPGLQKVNNILGCVPYTVHSGARYIYVFTYSASDKIGTIKYNRFNLDTSTWETEPAELEVDKNMRPETGIVEQTYQPVQAPYIGFLSQLDSGSKRIGLRQLNKEGNGFSDQDVDPLFWTGKIEHLIRMRDGRTLVITKNNSGKYFETFRLDPGNKTAGPGIDFFPPGGRDISVSSNLLDLKGVGATYDPNADTVRFYFSGSDDFTHFIDINTLSVTLGVDTSMGYKSNYIGPQLPYLKNVIFNGTGYKTGIWGGRLQGSSFANNYRLSPIIASPFELTRKLNQDQLQNIRTQAAQQYKLNQNYSEALNIYLQEAYYFVPMFLGLNLQRSKYYIEALDWFRTAFDYSVDRERRKIYYGLKAEESWNNVYDKSNEWLKDPKDPHRIAATRQLSYTRYTIFSIAQCFLDYADSEFTRDTAESVPRARTMYLSAIDLLQEEVYGTLQQSCESIINELDLLITDLEWFTTWEKLKLLALKVSNLVQFTEMVNKDPGTSIKTILEGSDPWEEKFAAILELIETNLQANQPFPDYTTLLAKEKQSLFEAHLASFSSQTLSQNVVSAQSFAISDFATGVAIMEGLTVTEVIDNPQQYTWLSDVVAYPVILSDNNLLNPYNVSVQISQEKVWQEAKVTGFYENTRLSSNYLPYLNTSFCVPTNPTADYQLFQAEINLLKIRNCMNISGLKRELDPYAAPTDAYSGLPMIGTGSSASSSQGIPSSASIYRYQYLVERARQTLGIAQQLESSLLSTLEKRDAEAYSVLKARQDISISSATIKLQDLRLVEAKNGETLAVLQKGRATIQVTELDNMIQAGLNNYENAMVVAYIASGAFRGISTGLRAFSESQQTLAISMGLAGISFGASLTSGVASAATSQAAGVFDILAIASDTTAQVTSIYAQFERRKQEWEFQKKLSMQDEKIGDQQIRLAKDRISIVEQEKNISGLQYDNAQDTLNFLVNKFTNKELYDWMTGVLQKTYNYFLQQATAQAKLAQLQLAFERQEGPAGIIQDDYYEGAGSGGSQASETTVDRRGLTGSARLQMDLSRLDNYAVETNQRKHQLTRILSLRTLFPTEFQTFRETGVLNFTTPMDLFDRDFPGHYMRLVKRVKTSVIALIPPNEGVKATLYNTGVSRVAVKRGSIIQTLSTSRPSESVALSSPVNASGLFELEPQNSEMYLPFEGTGVDTKWTFELLKASNPFNFNTIADVLIAIDYTSLSDATYRSRIFRQLNGNLSLNASRLYSMRETFPDAWYEFNNPAAGTSSAIFEVFRTDFSTNVKISGTRNVRLYFSFKDNQVRNLDGISLAYEYRKKGAAEADFTNVIQNKSLQIPTGTNPPIVQPNTGVQSDFLFGKWQLSLSNSITNLIRSGELQDVIFILDYSAEREKYPSA